MRFSALLQEVSLFRQSSVLLYQSSSLSPSVPASLVVLTASGAPVAAASMMPVLLASMMMMMMMMWHCPDLVLPVLLSRYQSGQCRGSMSMSRCMWRKMMLLAEEGCS